MAAAGRGRSATPPLAAGCAAAQPTAAAAGGAEPTAPPPLLCELADYLAASQREAEGRGEEEEVGAVQQVEVAVGTVAPFLSVVGPQVAQKAVH